MPIMSSKKIILTFLILKVILKNRENAKLMFILLTAVIRGTLFIVVNNFRRSEMNPTVPIRSLSLPLSFQLLYIVSYY